MVELCVHNLTSTGDCWHSLEVHIGAVSSVVAGTVGLCTDIQPLTAQSRIIGRGFHGVNRIDVFQRPAGHNDQGRVDLNGVCTFLAVDPLLICFNSQNGTLLGLIQRKMNVKGAQLHRFLKIVPALFQIHFGSGSGHVHGAKAIAELIVCHSRFHGEKSCVCFGIPPLGVFQISPCPDTIPVHPSKLVLGISIAPNCRHGVQSIRFRTALLHPLPPEVLSTQGIGSKLVIIFHRLTKPPGRLLVVLLCPVTMGMAFSYPVSQIALALLRLRSAAPLRHRP